MGKIIKRILAFIGLLCLDMGILEIIVRIGNYFNGALYFSIVLYLLILASFFGVVYLAFIRPYKKDKELRDNKKYQQKQEIVRLKEMPIADLLKQNELEKYCELFEKNGINKVEIAIELTGTDLLNMGINILGERMKLLKLFSGTKSLFTNKENTVRQNRGRQVNNSGKSKPALVFIYILLLVAIVLLVILVLRPGNSASTTVASSAGNTRSTDENWIAFTTWESSDCTIDFDENTCTITTRTAEWYGKSPLDLIPRSYTVEGNTVTLGGVHEDPSRLKLTREGGTLVSLSGERFYQQ